MAELVDALASGASVRMDVEVQVLFWAPVIDRLLLTACRSRMTRSIALYQLESFVFRPGGGIGRRASFRC